MEAKPKKCMMERVKIVFGLIFGETMPKNLTMIRAIQLAEDDIIPEVSLQSDGDLLLWSRVCRLEHHLNTDEVYSI